MGIALALRVLSNMYSTEGTCTCCNIVTFRKLYTICNFSYVRVRTLAKYVELV